MVVVFVVFVVFVVAIVVLANGSAASSVKSVRIVGCRTTSKVLLASAAVVLVVGNADGTVDGSGVIEAVEAPLLPEPSDDDVVVADVADAVAVTGSALYALITLPMESGEDGSLESLSSSSNSGLKISSDASFGIIGVVLFARRTIG